MAMAVAFPSLPQAVTPLLVLLVAQPWKEVGWRARNFIMSALKSFSADFGGWKRSWRPGNAKLTSWITTLAGCTSRAKDGLNLMRTHEEPPDALQPEPHRTTAIRALSATSTRVPFVLTKTLAVQTNKSRIRTKAVDEDTTTASSYPLPTVSATTSRV